MGLETCNGCLENRDFDAGMVKPEVKFSAKFFVLNDLEIGDPRFRSLAGWPVP